MAAFRRLSDAHYISEMAFKKGWKGTYSWNFRMGEMTFSYNEERLDLDFRSYRVKMVYAVTSAPKIFLIEPILPKTTKHLYRDGSLCLYKSANWQWQNDMKFDEALFPDICTWLYHYEVWCDTGNWYGEEAPH